MKTTRDICSLSNYDLSKIDYLNFDSQSISSLGHIDILIISEPIKKEEGFLVMKENQIKKIITYIYPIIPTEIVNEVCIRLQQELPVVMKGIDSIQSLFPLLSDSKWNTDFLCIDIEHFYNIEGKKVYDIINTLKTLIDCTVYRSLESAKPKKRNIKILSIVGADSDPKFMKETLPLVDGFAPRMGNGINYEDIKETVINYLNNDFTVPKKLQDILDTNKKPKYVYYAGDYLEKYSKETVDLLSSCMNLEFSSCKNWDEIDATITEQVEYIGFHISVFENQNTSIQEMMTMLDTKMKLCGIKIPVVVGIMKNTHINTIKELKQFGVFGIIPSVLNWDIDEAILGFEAMVNNISYWPKHILDQLPNDKKPKLIPTNGISLTPRQQQIFKLVATRGVSNKVIAKTLKITESTVKAHVSAILKAYGVRNRTQLFVSANNHP